MENNTCNEDLARQIETGKLLLFDCPPIIYSSNSTAKMQVVKPKYDLPTRHHWGKLSEEEQLIERAPSMWQHVANLSEAQLKQIEHIYQEMQNAKVREKNM